MKKLLPPGGDNRRWHQRALERERAKRYCSAEPKAWQRYVVRPAVNPDRSVIWDTRRDRAVYLCGIGGLSTDTSLIDAERASVALNRAYTAWMVPSLQAA